MCGSGKRKVMATVTYSSKKRKMATTVTCGNGTRKTTLIHMRNIINAERMKLRHTFGKHLTIIAPAAMFLLAMLLTTRTGMAWAFTVCVWNWWYVMLMPGTSAVFCYLVMKKDKKIKYANIFSLPMPPKVSLFGKIFYCSLELLFSNFLIFLGTMVVLIFFGVGILPFNGFLGALILTISGLWMIPLFLCLSARFGMFVCISTGFSMFFLGTAVFANTKFWWLFPAAVPVRLMCPVLGILPNGLMTPAGSEYSDASVILPGLLISIIWFVVLTFFTTIWFQRKGVEV